MTPAYKIVNGKAEKVQARPYYPGRPGLVDYIGRTKFPVLTDTTKGRNILTKQVADMRLMAHFLININPDGDWADNDKICKGVTRRFAGYAILDLVEQRLASVAEQVPTQAAKQYTQGDIDWAKILMSEIAQKTKNDPLWGAEIDVMELSEV